MTQCYDIREPFGLARGVQKIKVNAHVPQTMRGNEFCSYLPNALAALDRL